MNLYMASISQRKHRACTYRLGGLRRGGDLPRGGGNISRLPYMSLLQEVEKNISNLLHQEDKTLRYNFIVYLLF